MATGVLVSGSGAAPSCSATSRSRQGLHRDDPARRRDHTDDAEGEVVATADPRGVTDAAVTAGIAALTGPIQQVPSACQRDQGRRAAGLRPGPGRGAGRAGRPAGDRLGFAVLARGAAAAGCSTSTSPVECSSGTYVRALARDLGAALGVGGHLTALRRTRVGPFRLDHARTLPELEAAPGLSLSLADAVAVAFARRDVEADDAAALAHGRPLPAVGLPGTYGVFDPGGRVLALVTEGDGAARPVVVLAPAGG